MHPFRYACGASGCWRSACIWIYVHFMTWSTDLIEKATEKINERSER